MLFTWYVIRKLHDPQDEDDIELPHSEPQLKPASPSPSIKVVVGGWSDAPVKNLKYFCVKDKGYHVTVWPKDQSQFDIVEFNIAGMSHRDNIDDYLGEFKGTLEAEPTNAYDPNAIKVLAPDGSTQMNLQGGERIFSRISTKKMIKQAKKANSLREDPVLYERACKKLGKICLKELYAQNHRDQEYVQVPED